ncbi:PREDICTED: uncharacterized protein LOC105566559 isoform X2 [Vollenhovia emeryi]|nr:PREDICTED: uncharacterized protein LOC105566559 isoform X2 [Vollenhovia emeryi]
MIADSSSRLQRGTGSLATALRDRGPCVIPVQPNRSLPIRPAPPTPTRSATSIVTLRKTRSPILKLSKSVNLDLVELQSPSGSLTNELSEFPFGQQDGNGDGMMLTGELIDRSDYILPDMSNVVQITKEVNSVKRKNSEDRDRDYEKEMIKDAKKRRKSHEVDAGHVRDERVKNILKEYSRTCSGNLVDKGERKLQQHVVVRLWDDKRYASPVVVSTTEPEAEKKDICNKVVPPLRLKKVVREASTVDEYRRNVEVNTEGNESNYRIVTGATPRPESPSGYSAISFWSNVAASEKELESTTCNARDKYRRSSPKSDGYKIKYRRNRLRQKLRELRGKALELSREMTACNNAADTSPQRSTRLRQMMNCYEKQIENISKLLCKLSASIPPTTDEVVVDLDYENELDECASIEKTSVDSDDAQVNGISRSSVSPSPSPEPPKLSPRSPIDYEKGKSPDAARNTPPVLPRVYIAIQPTALECLKQNLTVAKSWHKNDSSPSSPTEKEVKVNDTDQTIIRDDVTAATVISPVSSSEFEDPRNSTVEWDGEEASPKLKSSEIEEKMPEDTKTFGDIKEPRQATPTIPSDSFLGSTMDVEIDGSDVRDTKERTVTQGHLDEVTQASETVASKQVACEKQELEQKSNEAVPSNPSIVNETKATEYGTYNSEERINSKNRIVTSTVTAAQEAPTMIGRPQVPAANVTNILQLQSNYYGSSVARENVVFTDVMQNSRDVQKVTSSMSQSAALGPAMPLEFTQPRSAVSSSNQQCIVLPNSCNKATKEKTNQRNDGNRIMTEQFPTLGNWVARMSKKQATKSKSKLQSGISLPTASTAEAARVPSLEAQKIRSSAPSNATRNNIVNVAPQWNTERWQRQQHQQRQQQLYAAASSAPVRPGICPPISVTQFYPSNYAIDPYGGAAFGYHSAICPYGDYPYHSRLHAAGAPPISGYQIGPLQDPHASSLRQMQHLDKRYPAHLQDTASRHFTTDLLKYSGTLSAGGYQHAAAAAAAAAGLDYDRLRTATAATQNGTASGCLPPLLLPPPPPLAAPAQQSLARTSLASYPASNGQCGRNRMIPDVVAAAAAAAVVAAASFGRQRGTLPSYGRTDPEMVSGGIGGVMDNESSQLMAANRVANREHLPQEQVQPVGTVAGVNVDSRLNNGGYRQLQNLLDRLPYVKADDAYSQSSTAIFDDNAQEPAVVSTSTYKSNSALTKEPARKGSRNCETPHLGKVTRTLETTSTLECSNCGLTGSMFKCLGCETAFYCDERCQTRHWNIHVEKCPKRMPKLKKLV